MYMRAVSADFCGSGQGDACVHVYRLAFAMNEEKGMEMK